MLKRIKLGVLSSLRSKTTKIAMICVLICELLMVFHLEERAREEKKEYYQKYVSLYTNFYRNFWYRKLDYEYATMFLGFDEHDIRRMDEAFDYLCEATSKAAEAIEDEDYTTFYRENIKANVLLTDSMVAQDQEMYLETDEDFFKNIEIVEKIKKDWNLPYHDVHLGLGVFDKFWAPQYISQTQYSYEMLERGIDELYTPSYLNGNTALYQFIYHLFPILVLLITVLLYYDQFAKEKRQGTIKNRLTQPKKRIRYLMEKIITNTATMLIVLLLPSLLCNLFVIFLNGFEFQNIPILAYPKGITSFTSLPNNLTGEYTPFLQTMGLTLYSGFPTLEYNAPHIAMELMDFHVFMGYVSVMTVLFIIFQVLLNQMITTMINNPYLGMIVNLGVGGICYINAGITNVSEIGMWNPYSYANPILNLAGTSYYTYAEGIVILGVYCMILFGMTTLILKKKDVI